MRAILKGDYLDVPHNTSTYMSLVRLIQMTSPTTKGS